MTCLACKSTSKELYCSIDSYDLFRCLECSLISVETMPSDQELEKFYNDYFKTKQYTSKLQSKIRRAKKRVKSISKYTKGKKFLDVGCNVGFAVEAARQLGLNANGIDVDNTAIDMANDLFPGCTFTADSVESVAEQGKKFDVIYCSEVIEHLSSLDNFVESLLKILEPKGVLLVTTPDMGHFSLTKDINKLITSKWIRPPEHLFYFTKQSIKNLFMIKGFSRIKFMISLKPTIKMLGFKD